ncbi:hypothetical protein AGLY_003872 [Aphis glycines]|uniref:Uncharacterized protein n=1 Tax=Aphis glycines TaxID=307491 RepID=A0A6G0TZY1_APHGL|nr:hypothetical protein AGLY_003872 [Aphis glycines]
MFLSINHTSFEFYATTFIIVKKIKEFNIKNACKLLYKKGKNNSLLPKKNRFQIIQHYHYDKFDLKLCILLKTLKNIQVVTALLHIWSRMNHCYGSVKFESNDVVWASVLETAHSEDGTFKGSWKSVCSAALGTNHGAFLIFSSETVYVIYKFSNSDIRIMILYSHGSGPHYAVLSNLLWAALKLNCTF